MISLEENAVSVHEFNVMISDTVESIMNELDAESEAVVSVKKKSWFKRLFKKNEVEIEPSSNILAFAENAWAETFKNEWLLSMPASLIKEADIYKNVKAGSCYWPNFLGSSEVVETVVSLIETSPDATISELFEIGENLAHE